MQDLNLKADTVTSQFKSQCVNLTLEHLLENEGDRKDEREIECRLIIAQLESCAHYSREEVHRRVEVVRVGAQEAKKFLDLKDQ